MLHCLGYVRPEYLSEIGLGLEHRLVDRVDIVHTTYNRTWWFAAFVIRVFCSPLQDPVLIETWMDVSQKT